MVHLPQAYREKGTKLRSFVGRILKAGEDRTLDRGADLLVYACDDATCDVRRATWNLEAATRNLQPATCDPELDGTRSYASGPINP